jgi:hypothetical protein
MYKSLSVGFVFILFVYLVSAADLPAFVTRSVGYLPWDQPSYDQILDTVFGPGGWVELATTIVPATEIFSPTRPIIWYEASITVTQEIFFTVNQALIEN